MSSIKSYLEENQIPAQRTPDGIYLHISDDSGGEFPQVGQYVKVHYTGRLLDGKKFDSSRDRNEPFTFQVGAGRVIRGWDIGVQLIPVGGKATLYIPHNLGYGEQGAGGGVIPPFANLVFDIELLETLSEEDFKAQQAQAQSERRKKFLETIARQFTEDREKIQAYAKSNELKTESTPTGLTYVIQEQGDGPFPEKGATVEVHYTGRLLDGTVFDSSHSRNQPIAFPIGMKKVIPGWDEGIALFREGGKGTLLIPSPLGYGPRGTGPIPPNSVLIFDIELVKVS